VPGVGPKTAKLIVVTLAGKIAKSIPVEGSESRPEVIAALVGLGWSEKLATEAVSVASEDASESPHDLLRAALVVLGNRKSLGVKSD